MSLSLPSRCRLAAALAGALPIFPALASAQELKHFWDFEGDATTRWMDKAGAAHGSAPDPITFAPAEDREGTPDSAVHFESIVGSPSDYLAIEGAELWQPGDEAFSFSYWFRMPDDGTSDPRGIFDFSGNGGDGVQSLYNANADFFAFRVDIPGAANALVQISPFPESDAWHFVVATYDPDGDVEVHIDGFGVDGSAAAVGGGVVQDASPYLGAFNVGAAPAPRGLGGELDDFAIYAGILTEAQIEGLFAGTLSPAGFLPREAPFAITRVERSDGRDTVYWPSAPGGIYSVWSSLTLEDGFWSELEDSIEGTGEEMSFTYRSDDPGRFYRIQDDADAP